LGAETRNPAKAEVKVQLGLPKLQVVTLDGTELGALIPNTTLPAVVTCTLLVVVLLPEAMEKPVPPDQLTVGVPVADIVPVTPLVYAVHGTKASEQAWMVNVLGVQVTPVALPCISR
jgi:hypothetical protein